MTRKRSEMSEYREDRGLSLERLEELLDGFGRQRVLVAGDVILDEYLWGDAERVSPEAPVPVVRVERESVVLGGAGNVARNVVSLGAQCVLCSVVGDDAAGERVGELISDLGMDPAGLVAVPGRPTTQKTRIVARAQQMLRYDRESVAQLDHAEQDELSAAVALALSSSTGVILEDYGKGTFTPALVEGWMRLFADANIPTAVDPKLDLSCYRGADLLKPNLAEAEAFGGVRLNLPAAFASSGKAAGGASELMDALGERLPGTAFAVTCGGRGMMVREQGGAPEAVPTLFREVFDVQGAGDTSIAVLCLARLAGGSLLEAAVIANAAAGVVVGKIGTAAATRQEVREQLPAAIAACQEHP